MYRLFPTNYACIYDRESFDETFSALNAALTNICQCASEFNLTINPKKRFVLHIGKGQAGRYSIADVPLSNCETVKDLGVIVGSRLDFSHHIEKATQKPYAALYSIFRNVCSNNSEKLSNLYKAYFLRHLEYCFQIWNPSARKHIIKLEVVQKIFTKLVYCRLHQGVSCGKGL